MWRWLRRLLVTLVALVVLIALTPIAGLAYGFLTTGDVELTQPLPPTAEAGPSPNVKATLDNEVAGYRRPEESTFLTYPEWAIVYAAREYAAFVDREFPSRFPYWAYAGRFWQDYALMIRASAGYPFNFGNHLMLVVIGTSHTIELAIQSIYENTVGRLTEAAAFWEPAPEDRYQAEAAAEYAAFLDQVPWYRFPYAEKRAGLWAVEPADGAAAIRSWERKLGFGASYSIKQGYAALIASGLSATSDAAFLDIHVWATGPVALAIADEPDTSLERDFGVDGAAFVTRRYQVFTEMIPCLIGRGVRFVEIGGNSLIFATFLVEAAAALPEAGQVLFSYRLPAEPETRRVGIALPVAGLHEALPALDAAGAKLEHVYDY
jgi:hypothetical protein